MDDELRLHIEEALSVVPATVRGPLLETLLDISERAVVAERSRAVSVCTRRGELWRSTSDSAHRALAEEARARSNEAFYLADLIETGQELPETDPSSGGPSGGVIEARGTRR